MKKRNPWAFKLDYAKEIASDSAQIALLTDPAFIAVCATIEAPIAGWRDGILAVFQWATCDRNGWRSLAECEARATMVGLTLADLEALSFYLDCWSENSPFQAPASREAYQQGKALAESRFIGWRLCTDSERRKWLAKARASLARHKRNAAKFPGK